jgi:hypothetical protein
MVDQVIGREASFDDDDELHAWLAMGFVEAKDGEVASSWAPLELSAADERRRYAEACWVGMGYAVDAIAHLKAFPDNPRRFVDLTRELVARGRWTAVEIGFFSALASYLAEGRIQLARGFEVVDLRPAASPRPHGQPANSA